MIPRILHRTVPEHTSDQVEHWWRQACSLHPDWEHITWRDPIDPAGFPITAPHWHRCGNGAQLAGLIRLEALHRFGGIYLDSDVEVYRTLEPLRQLRCFAAWEDNDTVPDAVLGAEPDHPAIWQCLDLALARLQAGEDAWHTGPGVTTLVLPHRHEDTLVLPPGAFYPYHWSPKAKRLGRHQAHWRQPYTFAAHHWHASWVPPEVAQAPRQRRRKAP